MNDRDIAAAGNEPGSASPDSKEDGPSSTTETSGLRRPLFDQIVGFFRPRNGSSSLREDLADALAETSTDEAAAFTPLERAMLNNVLGLREVRVEDCMVPRADIDGVDIATTLGELLRAFQESGHSRMPVYSESLDDPRGMVHIRDVLNHLTSAALATTASADTATGTAKRVEASHLASIDLSRNIDELGLIRTILFVPPSMQASELMARMQASHTQMALVIDEYGGTDGLVSLEDIVEMIVGDIEDEHDEEENAVHQTDDGVFIVNAHADIEDVAAAIPGFEAGELGEDVDTLSGLIFSAIGRVPVRGEVIHAIPGFEVQILEADPRRVRKVRLVRDPNQGNSDREQFEPVARSA